jgi:FMN-dependent NADH-azoreductase
MLEFFWTHNIDLALLQEFTDVQLNYIYEYVCIPKTNIEVQNRGTAILAKKALILRTSGGFYVRGEWPRIYMGHVLSTYMPPQ